MTKCKTSFVAVKKHEVIAGGKRGVGSTGRDNLGRSSGIDADLNGMFLPDDLEIGRCIPCK